MFSARVGARKQGDVAMRGEEEPKTFSAMKKMCNDRTVNFDVYKQRWCHSDVWSRSAGFGGDEAKQSKRSLKRMCGLNRLEKREMKM